MVHRNLTKMLGIALIWLWNGANFSIYEHVTHFVPKIKHKAYCRILQLSHYIQHAITSTINTTTKNNNNNNNNSSTNTTTFNTKCTPIITTNSTGCPVEQCRSPGHREFKPSLSPACLSLGRIRYLVPITSPTVATLGSC